MSTGALSRQRSQSSVGKLSAGRLSSGARATPPPASLTPENTEAILEPCAATASFLLYAQRNRILVLHHGTLAIERRFDLHREDIVWIAVDNASERGSGRLVVSYDAGNTAIVWDILTGGEVARFSAYETIKVAAFMRNGNIAFGNEQGNIILFEPSTSEHISARTIFDPITSIAPSADCLTFAIGYLNGSLLIAALQPTFTILNTLTSTRTPSPITGLAWHGSSAKPKTDMLAVQSMDGDLRVWSVPRLPLREHPSTIRILHRAEFQSSSPCWFAWSKNGRIIQHANGETRSWDVRTKKVSYETVPTGEGVIGLANYGPTAVLFTLTRNHGVQQYDINPLGRPTQVASVQHVPSNTPPTPPTTLDNRRATHSKARSTSDIAMLPSVSDTGESSTDEGANRSPLQRIAREMDSLDALEDEIRDKVMPLSPSSSRTSSVSSKSSGGRRRDRRYLYDRPDSSKAPSSSGGFTEFSMGTPSMKTGHDGQSIRSVSSFHSASRYRASNLRNQVSRGPDDGRLSANTDLFPSARSRVKDVPFRPPHYGNVARTPELLQREMLSVLFGWNDTARSLIRDELQRHKTASAAAVLLAKWLGDTGADYMSSMVGSESMSSSDWMMLALSSIGQDSQKKVGEAFVQRLLEKGDVHPAVAILIGLGEFNDAIEVYVSQRFWLEAVLLTCLTCPSDWQRISHLIREWGAYAVQHGQPDLAVRCFSCTSIETSEPWFSPRAQDAAYTAQQEKLTRPPSVGPLSSPPLSPPSRSGSMRLAQKNASLRLITTFGDQGVPVTNTLDSVTPMQTIGVTPIAQSAMPFSALSPTGMEPWQSTRSRSIREPPSALTATPGGFGSKKRLPSKSDIERVRQETARLMTPVTAARELPPVVPNGRSQRTPSLSSNGTEPQTSLKAATYRDRLTAAPADYNADHLPSPSAGAFTRTRQDSRGQRNTSQERKPEGLAVQVVETAYVEDARSNNGSLKTRSSRAGTTSRSSVKSSSNRSIDEYLDDVEAARHSNRERSKSRDGRKTPRSRHSSRPRDLSVTRGQNDMRYIRPAKRSPSSPIPMSPEEIAQATLAARPRAEPATSEDENFYKVASPVDSYKSLKSFRSEPKPDRERQTTARRPQSGPLSEALLQQRASDASGPILGADGRQIEPQASGLTAASSSSSLPLLAMSQPRAAESHDNATIAAAAGMPTSNISNADAPDILATASDVSSMAGGVETKAHMLRRKELAQRELEERRLSLARRPSAPAIPLPGEIHGRPGLGPRATTDDFSNTYLGHVMRSQTVDPEQMARYGKLSGISTPSALIGLPATPRAMRHPRYADADERDAAPPVPDIPDYTSNLSSVGSSLSQMSASNLGSAPSYLASNLTSNVTSNLTANTSYVTSNYDSASALSSQVSSNLPIEDDENVAPLLPSTVYGQKSFRAASAPPEKSKGGLPANYNYKLPYPSRRSSNVRKINPPEPQVDVAPVTSIDGALAGPTDQQVVIVPEDNYAPPMLPELQHLAGPPPPPPPPKLFTQMSSGQVNSSGVISISIDDNAPSSAIDIPTTLPTTAYPHAMERETTSPIERMTMTPLERATTASPTAQRRGRGSVSETFGSRFRDLGGRMRSTSRNQNKTPVDYKAAPYETVLPPIPTQHQQSHQRHGSESRAKSPYEQAMAAQHQFQPRGYPIIAILPTTLPERRIDETTIPPASLPRSQSAQGGYRHPKEIRANMPPETLQQGVYQGPGGNAF